MIDHRLHTLRILHREGTVTATAEVLHLTPSTVSQQLRQLARDLGVELLRPDGRNVRLTPAALTLLQHADLLYAQWERACAEIAAHRTGKAGRLDIASVPSALRVIVASTAARLQMTHPGLTVGLTEQQSDESFDALLTDRCDIGVFIPARDLPSPDDARFSQYKLLDEPVDILVPEGHPFAGRESVELLEAAEESWIVSPKKFDQYELLMVSCAEAGFAPRIAHDVQEYIGMSALIAEGFGISLVPRLAHVPADQSVVRVPLHGDPIPSRSIAACIRRGSEDAQFIKLGLEALEQTAADVRTSLANGPD